MGTKRPDSVTWNACFSLLKFVCQNSHECKIRKTQILRFCYELQLTYGNGRLETKPTNAKACHDDGLYFMKIRHLVPACDAPSQVLRSSIQSGAKAVSKNRHYFLKGMCLGFQESRETISPLQLAIHVVQNRRAGEQKSDTRTRQTKKITISNYVCLLFVLSQCDFCFPAWRFCTRWMVSCKGPITFHLMIFRDHC